MGEIDRTRIKSIYAEIKGYCENLPPIGNDGFTYVFDAATGEIYNSLIDRLNKISNTDYSQHKLDVGDQYYRKLNVSSVKMRMGAIISRLESEYDFATLPPHNQPAIAIFNQNQSNIDININFTIENLIETAQTDEEKENLQIIDQELKKPNASWNRLKNSLTWIINYSKDLSLKVIPIILNYYLKEKELK